MGKSSSTIQQCEIETLRARLREAEETLRAIHSGEVDALVISTERGEQVFTLEGADRSFRVLIENMSEGALTMTTEGLILYANRRFAEMLKQPLQLVIGSSLMDWIAPADREILQPLLKEEGGKRRITGLDLVESGGAMIPAHLSLINLELDKKTGANIGVVVTDLTERKLLEKTASAEKIARVKMEESKRLQQQAEQEKARLQVIIDTIPVGFVQVEANGKLSLMNEQGKNIWAGAVPLEEISDYAQYQGYWPETGERLQAEEWPVCQAILYGRETHGVILEIERFDGTRGTVITSAAPVKDQSGSIIGAVGSMQDITGHKKAEKALREHAAALDRELAANKRLHKISCRLIPVENIDTLFVELVFAAVEITNAFYGTLQLLDSRTGELKLLAKTNLSRQDLDAFGKLTIESASSCGYAVRDKERVIVANFQTDDRFAGTHSARTYQDAGLHAGQSTPLVSRSGQIIGVISTYWPQPHQPEERDLRLLDIIARQAADLIESSLVRDDLTAALEKLKEADRRKDEFLGVLSHEIRNPLASIMLSLTLLERVEPGGEQAAMARKIMGRQAKQLSRLVDDLLDVTRITQGKIELQKENFELGALVRRSMEDYQAAFQEATVAVEMIPAPSELYVEVDPARLSQVVGNLLHNAAKFTESGGYTRVSLIKDDLEQCVLIRVEDSGIGMSREMLKQLFIPFMQADTSLDRNGSGGLGLGLALSKGLTELHGGTISAQSDGLGKGSLFTVRLPLSAKTLPLQVEETATAVPFCSKRVLVIEDIIDMAESLRSLLAGEGHEVMVAYSGADGLAKAKINRPDILLCDIGLPGMDGYEVARAFCGDDDLKKVYLVSLTGYARAEDQQKALEAGFNHQLAKPVEPDKLKIILDKCKA